MGEKAPAECLQVAFADIPGWAGDDHRSAFKAFRLSALRLLQAPSRTRALGIKGEALARIAKQALALPEVDQAQARAFFETYFEAVRIIPDTTMGFVTGYYEPQVKGARKASERFPVPLYRQPEDLVEIEADDERGHLPPALTWARRRLDGHLEEHPDRAAIMAGALRGRGLEIAHVTNWVEAFFIHVQGSARIALEEGGHLRIAFAGKSGHPYFPIARVLVERGLMSASEATADVLRQWLLDHPDDAAQVMARNRSFIFFRESEVPDFKLGPIAAAGVPLSAGRSLAVDRHLHTFHTPIFVEADLDGENFRRLMIAQDTGSAILGPARGDIFFGTGEVAWKKAARVRHKARFTLLRPRGPDP